MSSGLEKACDNLLTTTSILSHEYGVPSLNTSKRFPAATTNVDKDLLYLESSYYDIYDELTKKLDQLIYTNKLKELKNLSATEVDALYQETIESKSYLLPSSDLGEIENYYNNQIHKFKTKTLLNNHLSISLPILRSIHHNDANLTATEINILHNLKRLFSQNNDNNDSSNINTLIDTYRKNQESRANYINLRTELSNLLEYDLKPSLKEFNTFSKKLKLKQDDILKLIEEKVSDVQLFIEPTDDTIDEDNETNGASELDLLQTKANQLVERWSRISIFSDLMPNLILCTPTNWYNDKSLLEIINDCENISALFTEYQLIVNIKTLNTISTKELLMIDFDELKFDVDQFDITLNNTTE